MKKSHIIVLGFALVAILGAAVAVAYRSGVTAGRKESQADWEVLIASGWLSGNTHRFDRWAQELDADGVAYVVEDYREHYDLFVAACEGLHQDSEARSLVRQHALTKLTPDD